MQLEELLPAEWELTPVYPWQLEIADDLTLALSKDEGKHLMWANTVAALDLFSLANPLGWTAGMTREEKFVALQVHFAAQLAEYVETLRQETLSGVRDPVGNFQKRVQGSMRRHYYDAYVLGRQQSDPYWGGFDAAELEKVRGLVTEEYSFLREFCRQLRAVVKEGQALPGNIDWRTNLYGQSLRRAYQMGIADGAREGDSITISAGPVSTDHCAECPPRWGTYSVQQYEAMGGPPQNWCEGISNCKCIVKVQHQMPPELRHILDLVKTLGELEAVRLPLPLARWRGPEQPDLHV